MGGWGRPGGGLALSVGNAPLVAVAHGSRDPRAAATVHALLGAVAARATAAGGRGLAGDGLGGGIEVRAAFLDHCAPSLPQVLASLGSLGRDDDGDARARSCIVVPLLLTAAYHSKSDIPAQLASAAADAAAAADGRGVRVRCAATLGPHPLLLDALERRLREAGVNVDSAAERARTSVVLAAAGSSDPAANATIADLGGQWQRERGWRAVVPAYASAAGPSPAEAVAALGDGGGDGRVVVATYLLAPGYFADKIRSAALAAGAAAVSDVLGAAPEVADVVLARYREARAREAVRERLQPDAGHPERAVMTPRLVTSSMGGNPRGTDLPARAPRRA